MNLYLLSSQTHLQARDEDASRDKTHTLLVKQSYFSLVVAARRLGSQGYLTSSKGSRNSNKNT